MRFVVPLRVPLFVPLLLLASLSPAAWSQEEKPKDRIVHFGGLRVNYTRKFIEIDAQVSLNRGLIELFACTPSGKAYESVMVLGCKPTHLMTGLILLRQKRGGGGQFQGDSTKPKGSKLFLIASWTDPKTQKLRRYFAEDLVWNQRANRSMKRTGWIFIGSRFLKNHNTGKEIFMASYTGTVIVTYHDPNAILDTPSDSGADDTTFYANHLLLPPRGTKLKLRIYPEKIYQQLPKNRQAMALPDFTKQSKKKATPPKKKEGKQGDK